MTAVERLMQMGNVIVASPGMLFYRDDKKFKKKFLNLVKETYEADDVFYMNGQIIIKYKGEGGNDN